MDKFTVRGHRIQLDEKRSVFVGLKDNSAEVIRFDRYIRFINSEGEETYLRLSPEAARALAQLLNNELGGAVEEEVAVESGTEFLQWVVASVNAEPSK